MHFTEEVELPTHEVVVNAPTIECLDITDDHLGSYRFKNVSSLVTTSIDVGHNRVRGYYDSVHANNLQTWLEGISHVIFLTLYPDTMEVLGIMDGLNLPLFPNLVHLKISVHKCNEFGGLPDLLSSVPNVVTLEIFRNSEYDGVVFLDEPEDVEPETWPVCFLSCLEEII